jgi:glycosyltransferase involved in cell wall biosynthesis
MASVRHFGDAFLKMLFSVVIPTFNRAGHLRQALDSVFAQTFGDYEVIVVDDGSTDDTEKVANHYGNRIQLFRQSNQGPGAARNLGIQEARGEFVAFLDSDDIWFPWTLKNLEQVVARPSRPGFIAGKLFDFKTSTDLAGKVETEMEVVEFRDYLSAARTSKFTILTCSCVVVRRSELNRAGGFTNQHMNGEDSDLWLRLGIVPGFAVIESPVTCGYRRHPGSAVANLEKTFRGMNHLIATEFAGAYPGGVQRRRERIEIISRHVRSASRSLARNHDWRHAISLYVKIFRWLCQLGKWKYLVGFWPELLLKAVRDPKAPTAHHELIVQP